MLKCHEQVQLGLEVLFVDVFSEVTNRGVLGLVTYSRELGAFLRFPRYVVRMGQCQESETERFSSPFGFVAELKALSSSPQVQDFRFGMLQEATRRRKGMGEHEHGGVVICSNHR